MREHRFRLSPALLGIWLLIFLLPAWATTTFHCSKFSPGRTPQDTVTTLELERPLERTLAGGQTHTYAVTLAAGEMLRLSVEQRGINVAVTPPALNGKPLAELNNAAEITGVEEALFIAEVAGNYQFQVRAVAKDAAEGRYEVRIRERQAATKQDEEAFADWLQQQAGRWRAARQPDAAITAGLRALSLKEKLNGADSPKLIPFLTILANSYRDKGESEAAEPLFLRALALTEKLRGPEHIDVAGLQNTLALLYQSKGEHAKAQPLLERALPVVEKQVGADHPNVAAVLNNLAITYQAKGDYKQADSAYRRALEIRQKRLKPEDPAIALSLNNLASLCLDKGEWEEALKLFTQTLELREKIRGPEHMEVAATLNNLAVVYQEMGELAEAEPRYQRALAIYQKAGVSENPEVARALNNLAVLTLLKGDYDTAEPLYARALAIRQKTLGPQHPLVAKTLDTFAVLYDLKGDVTRAAELRVRGMEIRERHLGLILATGSEEQKRAYLTQATLADETNIAISLNARSAPGNPQVTGLALNFVLQRKGRVLDAMTDSIGRLRARLAPEDRALLEQLAAANSRLATLILSGQAGNPQQQTEIARLEKERQQLEAAISARSADYSSQSQAVTFERVRKLLPVDGALIEMLSYLPFDPRQTKAKERFGPARYAAYVLKPEGAPFFVELGEAEKIDRAVLALREALGNPRRSDVKRLARQVDELVMRPLRAKLGETRRLLLSPDGTLNLLPFAALVDERNRYLLDRYTFSYLTSGRDLLRLEARQPNRQGALIVANPDFGESKDAGQSANRLLVKSKGAKKAPAESATTPGINMSQFYFSPLPGTAGEARQLKAVLPEARLLTGTHATEAALKQVNGPSLLHIATHGFFLSDQLLASTREARLLRPVQTVSTRSEASLSSDVNSINPLLRSGLALAGANLGKSDNDDGILTALEVMSLDLSGTKLVVLSACETGVGEVKAGDGVYGLRRALVLAGSESQVMSLWPVSDFATRDLMSNYYRSLQKGLGRTEALRQVQVRMLKSQTSMQNDKSRILTTKKQQNQLPLSKKDYSHPYYWASFIQSGEWANLDGKR